VRGTRILGPLLAAVLRLLPGRNFSRVLHRPSGIDVAKVFPAAFLALLDVAMARTLPASFADDFPARAQDAQRHHYRPGRLRLGTVDYWNDDEKMIAAEARRAGEELVLVQHGGFYGVNRWNILATEGEYRAGAFLNWGFDAHDDYQGTFLPAPSPLLGRFRDRHRDRTGGLIVVGDPIRFGVTRIVAHPRGAGWIVYCRDVLKLFENLGEGLRHSAWMRPYVNARVDIDVARLVLDRFPAVRRLDGDLHGAMLDCRMIVHTGTTSTMHFSMAANTPTVAYWRADAYPLCRQAQSLFDALRAVGVVHDSPEAAAAHINAVWNDVPGWWNGAELQRARAVWCRQLAYAEPSWWWHWLKVLSAYALGGAPAATQESRETA
jgi:putative transferase (TIGR04331 family)